MGFPSVIAERLAALLVATPPAPGPGQIRIHIDVDPPAQVVLYEETIEPDPSALGGPRTRRRSTPICEAPCDRTIDVGPGRYVSVGGPRLTRSSPFLLAAAQPEVNVGVRPGAKALTVFGWIFAGVGAGGLIGGATTLTFADNDTSLLRTGGIILGASIPLIVAGGLMIARGRTKIRVNRQSTRK